MLDKKTKQKIINKYRTHAKDTGSVQVQIAILTEEIKQLTTHLQKHKHDNSSRRGILQKVGERRRLLKYLQRENEAEFSKLAISLKLKIAKKMIEEEEERKKLENDEEVSNTSDKDEKETLENDDSDEEKK